MHRWTERTDWFRREEIAPDIERITEPHYRADYRCNIYLIRGRDQSVVLDTGLGLASLRAFLTDLDAEPILVSSHSHYDHIGGNWEFRRRLIHPAEAAAVAAPTPASTLADLLLATEDFYDLPWKGFEAKDWVAEPAPATGLLGEGDTLDLGERRLKVLHTPGHSWGSLSLWEAETGLLFCADAVYAGELFDHLPCSDIPTYVQTMRRLQGLPVRLALPGHGPALTGDEFQAIVQGYLEKNA
jgi:glyoxylase-like metal-dependent hydrolase (beta-lactamase superfamily II)